MPDSAFALTNRSLHSSSWSMSAGRTQDSMAGDKEPKLRRSRRSRVSAQAAENLVNVKLIDQHYHRLEVEGDGLGDEGAGDSLRWWAPRQARPMREECLESPHFGLTMSQCVGASSLSALTHSEGTGSRLSLAKMVSAGLVQMKGLSALLWARM